MRTENINVHQHADKLIKILSPYCKYTIPDEVFRGKRRYNFCREGEQFVYILEEGDYLVKRRQDHKTIELISSPSIIGFLPAIHREHPIYLERIDYGKIKIVSLKQCMRVIFAHHLMPDVLYVLSHRFAKMVYYISDKNGNATKEVCNAIISLSALPPHIKKRFTALSLIEETTHLSKSSISRILRKLQDNGELSLDKGHFK